MKKQLTLKIFLLFIFSGSLVFSQDNLNVILGYPDSLGFIIEYPQYVISYSSELNSARWASWYVDRDCYGQIKRYRGKFITDTNLPTNYAIIRHSDYTRSGYDRGHLVKSEDRSQTTEDNKATFFLTNVIPQKPELNRRIWLQLENYYKQLAKDNKQLFIIAGGWYSENPQKINKKIAIPDSCWKVILILDSGKTISDIDSNTQTIAVMMPNDSNINKKEKWDNYLTTISHIEHSTGFNFYRYLEKEIQDVIKNKKYQKINTDALQND